MAAHNLFTTSGATVAGVTLRGYVQVTVNIDGTEAIPRGDGKFAAERSSVVWLDEIVEIVAEDISQAPAVGATGALTVNNAQLLNGLNRGNNFTVSAANCVVLSSSIETSWDGQSRLRIRARALSADGVSPAISFTGP